MKDHCSECRERIVRADVGWVGHGFLCSRIGRWPDASEAGLERADQRVADEFAARFPSQGKDGKR
jgi:hypothetical protein